PPGEPAPEPRPRPRRQLHPRALKPGRGPARARIRALARGAIHTRIDPGATRRWARATARLPRASVTTPATAMRVRTRPPRPPARPPRRSLRRPPARPWRRRRSRRLRKPRSGFRNGKPRLGGVFSLCGSGFSRDRSAKLAAEAAPTQVQPHLLPAIHMRPIAPVGADPVRDRYFRRNRSRLTPLLQNPGLRDGVAGNSGRGQGPLLQAPFLRGHRIHGIIPQGGSTIEDPVTSWP